MKLDSVTLKQISPLLDELLELDARQREGWLAQLNSEVAHLAPILRELLFKPSAGDTDALLERGPAFTLPKAADQAYEFHIGDQIGPYRLLRELGQGGMGEVWLAERADGMLKRPVALKLPMLSLRRNVLLQRFEHERDILSGLVHPNIARLYDAGFSDEGQPYLALEYAEGQPITDYCEQKSCGIRERIQLLLQVMTAVQYAHSNLVIHRDLKPSNILVNSEGKATLLDFGVAKLLEETSGEADESALTQFGGRALTLDYASPEQISGSALGTATDVYSLGVLLFELLTSRRPFSGARHEREKAILADSPVLPRNIAPDLANIVAKALKKSPTDRYSTVNAFAEDLQRWLKGEAVLAQPESRMYRLQKFISRYRLQVALAGAGIFAITAVAAVAVVQGIKAREETKRAIAARDFLVDMFRFSDTDGLSGKVFGAKDLLVQGKKNLVVTLNNQPSLQAEVLRAIATAELNLGEYRTAEATLTDLANRYQQMGQTTQLGQALVSKASALFLAGDGAKAEKLLDEAWLLLRDHQNEPAIIQNYYHILSAVAVRNRRLAVAEEASIKSFAMAEKLYGKNHLQTIRALSALGRMRSWNREYEAARAHFDDAWSRANSNTELRPRDRIWLTAERAEVSNAAGHFRLGAQQYAIAREQCDTLIGSSNQLCAKIARGEAATRILLGDSASAAALFPSFGRLLDNAEAPLDQMEALMTACRILIFENRSGEKPEWWVALRQLSNANLSSSVDNRYKVWAMLIEAERLINEKQPSAQSVLNEAERALAPKLSKTSREFIRVRLYQGLAAQQSGAHEAALSAIGEATDRYTELLGPMHTRTLLASLHRARSLAAIGRRAEAISLVEQALPTLQDRLGPSSPLYLRAIALRTELTTNTPAPVNAHRNGIFL